MKEYFSSDEMKMRNIEMVKRYVQRGDTYKEIGIYYDLSTERVRQILARFNRILRHPSRSKDGERYFSTPVEYKSHKMEVLDRIERFEQELQDR